MPLSGYGDASRTLKEKRDCPRVQVKPSAGGGSAIVLRGMGGHTVIGQYAPRIVEQQKEEESVIQ